MLFFPGQVTVQIEANIRINCQLHWVTAAWPTTRWTSPTLHWQQVKVRLICLRELQEDVNKYINFFWSLCTHTIHIVYTYFQHVLRHPKIITFVFFQTIMCMSGYAQTVMGIKNNTYCTYCMCSENLIMFRRPSTTQFVANCWIFSRNLK